MVSAIERFHCISNASILHINICHVTLSPQIWNLETFSLNFRGLLCPLNLIFQMLTFRMLTFPMLLCHEAFLLSKTKCAILKYEMCRRQIRKMWQFQIWKMCQFQIRKRVTCKYEKVSISNTKIRYFQKKEMGHFQIWKMCSFQIRKYATFKNKKCLFFNYQNVPC